MISITPKTSTLKTTAYNGRKIQYIVIHYTAGVSSKPGSAANTARYFATSDKDASADFIVDDATIVQYNPNPRRRYCWAVGGAKYGNKGGRLYGTAKNTNCVSIEICSTNSTGKMQAANSPSYSFTDAALRNALELTKHLMAEYGVDADHVIRHYDVNGKPCPGIIGWNAESGNESKWAAFKAQLTGGAKPSGGNLAYVGKGIGAGTAKEDMAVRDRGGTKYAKIGVVYRGEKVEILEKVANGWLKIVWPGSPEGFAYTSNAGGGYYDVTMNNDKAPSKTPKWVGRVNCHILNVHVKPDVNSANLSSWPKLARNNLVDVCDTVITDRKWYYIRIAGKYYGYVDARYITSV